MKPGEKFGQLTISAVLPGAKNKHPTAQCICECGTVRTARMTKIRRGLVRSCVPCSRSDGARRGGIARSLPEDLRGLREKLGIYRANARAKNITFELTETQVTTAMTKPCHYCGSTASPLNGMDRVNNSIGYTVSNVVPCCSTCNYAKRHLSVDQFIAWVRKVYDHQRLL
jgi:hypothetical protein